MTTSKENYTLISLVALSVSLTIIGGLAFLFGADYGVGFFLLTVLMLGGVFWVFITLKVERSIEQLHTAITLRHPRVLTLVPAKVARSATRRHRTRQTQINNYLTEMAAQVDRHNGHCSCCGRSHSLLSRYPFDLRLHKPDCEVALAFPKYGSSPEICPWGLLTQQPHPILLLQLSDERVLGLHHYATIQADEYGFGTDHFFQAIGREYLILDAVSKHGEALEPIGRRVVAELVSLGAFNDRSDRKAQLGA